MTAAEVTKGLITDMPAPAWWEFLFQWGGLAIQAAAALATLAAVCVALSVARRDSQWRQDLQQRELALVWEVILVQVKMAKNAVSSLNWELAEMRRETAPRTGRHVRGDIARACSFLNFDSLWKVFEKVGWLPTDVARELGKLLVIAPIFVEGIASLVNGDAGDAQTFNDDWNNIHGLGTDLISCCDLILKDAPLTTPS